MGTSLRDYVFQISPRWLQGTRGGKVMYCFGIAADLLLDKSDQGQRLHIPTFGDPSALPFIGADRLIQRGPFESDDSYAHRLQLSWDDWGFAGAARAVLRQTLSYWLPKTPQGETVSDDSIWNVYLPGADTSQPPAHYNPTGTPNWDWDSLNLGGGPKWWRIFLIHFPVAPNDFAHPEDVWGVGTWGDPDGSWGLDIPSSFVASIKIITRQWKGAHAWYEWIIFSFDLTLFRPDGVSGVDNPDGRWGRWSKIVNGQYVPSRNPNARYADGP